MVLSLFFPDSLLPTPPPPPRHLLISGCLGLVKAIKRKSIIRRIICRLIDFPASAQSTTSPPSHSNSSRFAQLWGLEELNFRLEERNSKSLRDIFFRSTERFKWGLWSTGRGVGITTSQQGEINLECAPLEWESIKRPLNNKNNIRSFTTIWYPIS